jgi:pimeloyl-ACP methyl ester carboxylesterase
MGGLAMRVFAERYPSATAAMVLVDATSPDTTLGYNGRLVHMRELAKDRPIPDVQTMTTSPPKLVEKPGNSAGGRISPPFDRLPADIRQLQLWARSRPPRAAPGEDYLPEETKELYEHSMASAHPLGDRPLITIVALRNDPAPPDVAQEVWDRLFQEKVAEKRGYAALSTNSRIVEDPKSRHTVQLDDPDTVVTAIRDVLNAAARHTRLTR